MRRYYGIAAQSEEFGHGRAMDRTALAACAGLLLPLGSAVSLAEVAATPLPAAPQAAIQPAAPGALPVAACVRLPRADASSSSPEIDAAVRRADLRVRKAFDCASRGALFSARGDLIAALRTIAQAKDAQQASRVHGDALTAGLTALDEAADFLGRSLQPADLKHLVATHTTAVLQDAPADTLTAPVAAERYLTFAQAQLGAAVGQQATGSMALLGLAKVTQSIGDDHGNATRPALQAEALYKAALLADPNNFCAANELGVLVAQQGRLEEARDLLVRCVATAPHPTTWHNLAAVHARLGEAQLAAQAQAQADALPKPRGSRATPNVEWLDPQTFAGVTNPADSLLPPLVAQAEPASKAANTSRPAAAVAKQPTSNRLPWNPRR
jgi:tetratricopeptide (TPR) repeat protein